MRPGRPLKKGLERAGKSSATTHFITESCSQLQSLAARAHSHSYLFTKRQEVKPRDNPVQQDVQGSTRDSYEISEY